MNQTPPKRKIGLRGCLFTSLIFIVILVLIPLSLFWSWRRASGRRLQDQLELLSKSGAPSNAMELEDYYVVASDNDCTKIWLAGIGPLQGAEAAAGDLPIVGTGDADDLPPPGKTWDQLEAAEALLEQYAAELKILHEAARKGGAARYTVNFSDGFSAQLPHVQSIRNAGRMLTLEAHVRAHRGDVGGTIDSLATILAAAESLREEPVLISQLVRLAIRGSAIRTMANLTPHLTLEPTHWDRLSKLLDTADVKKSIQRSIAGERVLGLIVLSQSGPLGETEGIGFVGPRDDDKAFFLESMQSLVEAAELPADEAIAAAQAVDDNVSSTMQSPLNRLRYMGTGMIMPAGSTIIRAGYAGETLNQVGKIVLVINRYRQQHGVWPESLEALVPAYLPQVPLDTYGGKSLVYRKHANGYLLYSVGSNGSDDGGKIENREDVGVVVDVGK